MSFPGDKFEKIFSNDIEDVAKFLDETHGKHYHVYNLCEERSYDRRHFHGRVSRYPIEDLNPPAFEMMLPFCEDVDSWLSRDPRNVAVVHCHAGKGRTGTMICAYLLYKRMFNTAEQAVDFYHSKRVLPDVNAFHPGARRYIRYFNRLIHERFVYRPTSRLLLVAVEFNQCPVVNSFLCSPCFTVQHSNRKKKFKSPVYHASSRSEALLMQLHRPPTVSGDVKFIFYDRQGPSKKMLFWTTLNTYFVSSSLSAPPVGSASDAGGQWRTVPVRPGTCHDGSRQGHRSFVSIHTVREPGIIDSMRPISVVLPQPELDIFLQYQIDSVLDPQFTVKIHFAAVPDNL